ncbi:MAG: Nif11-like leader peptide family RiPP precursor [Ruthenibacterium sp.]
MNKNLEKFLEMAKSDTELQKKLDSANSIEELYAVASATVSGFSLDEFAAIAQQNSKNGITDEELGAVAGGNFWSLDEWFEWRKKYGNVR